MTRSPFIRSSWGILLVMTLVLQGPALAIAQSPSNSTTTTMTALPSFNLGVGAVAALALMLIGLAAGLLLLARFTWPRRIP